MIDDDIAARLEPYLAPQCLFNLRLNSVFLEDREFFGVVMGEASYIAYGTVGANEMGVVEGAVSASAGIIVDSSKNITGFNKVTSTSFSGIFEGDVVSGSGFRYMSSLNTHFGVGSDSSVNSITVYWPSGTVDVINNPGINTTINITE